jgi:hypothetical protein
MNFEDALDTLIVAGITCLRHHDIKLKRAIEIAINYRELSPNTKAPVISAEQLDALQRWLAPMGVAAEADERAKIEDRKRRIGGKAAEPSAIRQVGG